MGASILQWFGQRRDFLQYPNTPTSASIEFPTPAGKNCVVLAIKIAMVAFVRATSLGYQSVTAILAVHHSRDIDADLESALAPVQLELRPLNR